MANKKSNDPQPSGVTKASQIIFAIFAIILILSLILSAFITP